MKRVVLVVLLLASLASLTVLTSAQETLEVGTVEGTLSGKTATYKLVAEAGDEFFIFLSSPDFDTYLEVLNAAGENVAYDDDSGFGSNSVLLFVAPDSATYTVNARAYDGDATGAYALTLVTEIEDINVGDSVDLEMDGTTPMVFRYEAAGDPVNITVDSGGEIDTSLKVVSTDGYAVDSSDDAIGSDPALTPIILSAGTYYLIVVPYSEEAVGTVALTIEPAEIHELGAEPTIFTLGVTGYEDLASLKVEEGQLYRFEISSNVVSDFNLSISAADSTQYTYGYLNYTNGLGGTYLYLADISGELKIEINAGYGVTNDEPVEYSITVTEVSQE